MRPVFALLVVALFAILPGTALADDGTSAHFFAVTCGDFPSQQAAQAAYRKDPAGLRKLDHDLNGIACEGNPAPRDLNPVDLSDAGGPAPGGSQTGSQPGNGGSNGSAKPPASGSDSSEPPCTYFPQTGGSLCRGFRQYWRDFGGLAVYGYPITGEFVDKTTGKVTQWFERARFEWQQGSWPARYDVELGLLGVELTSGRMGEKPFQPAAERAGCTYYPSTGHNLCGGFRAYWQKYGGLAVYGMPISEEFQENGVTVQYFERQRFEWHPGEWPERFDVELGLLGTVLHAESLK
ncbi:MAG TPA: excalibur calcium-binding domain-containing protein [Thermomicrobiaceae bacterium]|nr:excalibur calcium-binding domain-containing protein [Thermomicrobiaceae bacterium]